MASDADAVMLAGVSNHFSEFRINLERESMYSIILLFIAGVGVWLAIRGGSWSRISLQPPETARRANVNRHRRREPRTELDHEVNP
jgi:hypothetical protein